MSPEWPEQQQGSRRRVRRILDEAALMGEGGKGLGVPATSPERVWESRTMAIGNHGPWPTSSREAKLLQIAT